MTNAPTFEVLRSEGADTARASRTEVDSVGGGLGEVGGIRPRVDWLSEL